MRFPASKPCTKRSHAAFYLCPLHSALFLLYLRERIRNSALRIPRKAHTVMATPARPKKADLSRVASVHSLVAAILKVSRAQSTEDREKAQKSVRHYISVLGLNPYIAALALNGFCLSADTCSTYLSSHSPKEQPAFPIGFAFLGFSVPRTEEISDTAPLNGVYAMLWVRPIQPNASYWTDFLLSAYT